MRKSPPHFSVTSRSEAPREDRVARSPQRGQKTDIEVAGIGKGFECYISLEGIIDVAKEKERLAKEIERVRGSIERARAKLDNKEFVSKAPEAVIAKEKDKLMQFEVELEKFEKNLKALGD
jgi:valyl-tRNA synthetase